MTTLIKTEEYKNLTIEIHYDDTPFSPREDDNLSILWYDHERCSFPKEIDLDTTDCQCWDDIEDAIEKQYNPVWITPVYMMDHSGLAFSLSPFGGWNGHFDSGQIGFAFTTRERVKDFLGYKNITSQRLEQIAEIVEAEIHEFGHYANGQVYGYRIRDANDEILASCWGFIGDSDDALTAAKDYLDSITQ